MYPAFQGHEIPFALCSVCFTYRTRRFAAVKRTADRNALVYMGKACVERGIKIGHDALESMAFSMKIVFRNAGSTVQHLAIKARQMRAYWAIVKK